MMGVMIIVVVVVAAGTLAVFLLFLLLLLLLLLFASSGVSPIRLILYDQRVVRALGGTDTRPVNNRCDAELEIFLILLGQSFHPRRFLTTAFGILCRSTITLSFP
jgi:hypothetical protein